MKQEIHPEWFSDAVVVCQCGNTWKTGATVAEIRTEICSNCHPFYTGEQRIVDTEGRVDKFMDRLRQRDQMRADADARKAALTPSDLPLKELGINTRYLNILIENELEVVDDVLKLLNEEGEDGLLALSGIGRQALSEIKKSLRAHGYELPNRDEEAEDEE